jgi:hypothetical protein
MVALHSLRSREKFCPFKDPLHRAFWQWDKKKWIRFLSWTMQCSTNLLRSLQTMVCNGHPVYNLSATWQLQLVSSGIPHSTWMRVEHGPLLLYGCLTKNKYANISKWIHKCTETKKLLQQSFHFDVSREE